MTISGGIKFFKKNKGLAKDGATITATSNDGTSGLMIDVSKDTAWESSGSDDTTTETIEWTLAASSTIDRILIADTNAKDFNVKYWTGAAWALITSNVIGLDGSQADTSETAFSDTTIYYEFDALTTTKLQINILKTQVADEEKTIATLVATEELGTFTGYPQVTGPRFTRNERSLQSLSSKFKIFKSFQTFAFSLTFTAYSIASDITLTETLFDSEDPFLVWLCGGRRTTDYFQVITAKGYNLTDLFQMQVVQGINPSYETGVYLNGVNQTMTFTEAL